MTPHRLELVTSGPSNQTRTQTIRIITSDLDLYAYLEDCIARIPGMQVWTDGMSRPDLLVTDDYGPGFREDPEFAGIPRLHVLDEPPAVGKSEPIEFILTPFDARTVAHSVLRALRQPRDLS